MAEKRIRVTLTRSEYRTTVCAGGLPIPNPSNSDLVGEARRLSEADLQGHDPLTVASWVTGARTLLPELAQQLEQAEQRAKREHNALVTIANWPWGELSRTLEESWHALRDHARAALTTPDSATEQEEG